MSNNLKRLAEFGQSPWIDMISRTMIDSGELQRLRDEDGLKGLTSNPSIFEAAIARSSDYDEAIARALRRGIEEPKALFEELAVRDIRDAADLLLPIYEESGGADGFVSLEVSPELAYDTERTIAEGERLFKQVGRKNLMIKVPATSEGLPAAAQLIGRGINVNVTLIFSIQRYREVMESYLEGLEALAKSGKPLAAVASVASFFISRLDTAIDEKLPAGSPLRGKAAVANAKIAYQTFQEIFSAPRFAALRGKGALVQRPLWASTGTKNADYNDVLYVDGLIGRDTVNTIPPKTWAAFRDHGSPTASLTAEVEAAETTIKELAAAGIDLDAVTSKLEKDGVDAFMRSFQTLLDSIRDKASHLHNDPDPAEIVQRLWDKDASLWKDEAAHKAIIANSLGWLRMPQTMPDRLEGIETFVREVLDEGFQHVVVLGMGGSSLAPEVFRRTLPTASGYPTLHVLDSTDPETVSSVEQAAPPAKTLYIVASKSGTTVEPMRFFDYFYGVLKKAKGGEAGKHFVAITDPGRALMAQAQELGFRKIFLNFEDIGGRFSALSYFGLVPAALAGADIGELLERAHKMADACAMKSPDNPGYALGRELGRLVRAGRDKLHFLLPPELASFGLWLEQLLAESTGKENQGVVPVTGEPPLEPERCGGDEVFIYLKLKTGEARSLDAAAAKLEAGGQPLIVIELNDVFDLGGELFRWEFATAVLGHAMGINPFDQPNVQAAKEKTVSLLTQLKRGGKLPHPEAHINAEGLCLTFSSASEAALGERRGLDIDDALTRFLADARPKEYAGLLAYVCSDGRYEKELAALRDALNKATNLSVQAGYGPRYLHSTGQLHKGGANNGLFIVISREDGPDLEIAGADYTFGQLVRAQALGDYQALEAAGRRAVFVRITGDVEKALMRLTAAFKAAAHTAMKV